MVDEAQGSVDLNVVELPQGSRRIPAPLATELASLVDAEFIRLLDVLVVETHADRSATVVEAAALDDVGDLEPLVPTLRPVLGPADLEHVARTVGAGVTVALIVWDNIWAVPVAEAARRSGGELVASERLHRPVEPARWRLATTRGDQGPTR